MVSVNTFFINNICSIGNTKWLIWNISFFYYSSVGYSSFSDKYCYHFDFIIDILKGQHFYCKSRRYGIVNYLLLHN